MSRHRSEEKRDAVLAAAIRVFATQGLGAPTALIAKEAGVSNGSLFTYFPTKIELLNELYLELKSEMAFASVRGLPAKVETRKQMLHIWRNWMKWAAKNPGKRRTLALLNVSDALVPQSRAQGHKIMAGIAALLERSRANGPMRQAPMGFVVALLNSIAEATIDFMILEPRRAASHSKTGFEALWRVLA
jgi:AcrR family transcriptional regulator